MPHRWQRSAPVGIGKSQALDLRVLWEGVAGPAGGGYFTADELAQAWWGDQGRAGELETEVEKDDLYFVPDTRRTGVYRVHTKAQIELSLTRREVIATGGLAPGHALILRDQEGHPHPHKDSR